MIINSVLPIIYISLGVILFIGLLIISTAYICYKIVFYVKPEDKIFKEEFPLPDYKEYIPFHDQMLYGMKYAKSLESTDHYITSFDGLKLHAKYYKCNDGNVMEIMFHGYRGSAYRDLSNGIERAFLVGHNVLLIDQRASSESEGNTITFGINERHDCLSWIDYVIKSFNPNMKIMLTGVSMGAATVLMASNMELPQNVIGILADCGYSSPKEIIMKCTKDLKLPAKPLYPFIKLGARLFGHFNIDEASPIESVKKTKLPIIFYHGATDDFVPCYMSEKLYEACVTPKKLVIIDNCGHGLAYLVDKDKYINELKDFILKYEA
jgi:pimeloyl-ACP methyl ester carboxylesterase